MQIRRSTGLLVLSLMTALFLAACGGGGGDSAPPPPDLSPAATTLPASSITSNSAVLSAIVNPKGLSTIAYFEYSKDPALVTNVTGTSPQAMGSGSTDNTITQAISGLESGQTYYYRVTAVSSAGTKNGAIFTFSTLPLPTVTTNPATSITTTGAVLNGVVNPNGRQTTARFEYGETPALGTSVDILPAPGAGTDNVNVSTTLIGLKVATKYYFRIVGTSSVGTANGTTLEFTTAGGVPTVATQPATSVTAHGAVLNGTVNPSALPTNAWFEYGIPPLMGTVVDNQFQGSGTITLLDNATLINLLLNTQYQYRIVASNSVGTSFGETFSFPTLNPPPTADAGPDQLVYMAGPEGDTFAWLGNTFVTLAGSGSVDPAKTITSYLWEQSSGTPVVLDVPASQTPTFTAPVVSYGASEDLQFKLTVTDNTGLTGTDNVLVTVKWGFRDEFNTAESPGTYSTFQTLGTTATFTYDAAGKRGRVLAGSGQGIKFQKLVKMAIPGPDVSLITNTGVFSLVFNPTSSGGNNISIRLGDTATTYYELSTFPGDDSLKKVREISGVETVVDTVPFTRTYSPGGTYPIKISFAPFVTTVEAFGGTATINTEHSPIAVAYFEVRVDQQNANFDNITFEAAP